MADETAALSPTQPFRFLNLPGEIRELVYAHVLNPAANRTKLPDSYIKYHFNLSLYYVSRQVYTESLRIFHKLNKFAALETPWPQAQDHVRTEGYVPILVEGERAQKFRDYVLLLTIDAPEYSNHYVGGRDPDSRRFIVHVDDLRSFAEMWHYSDLTHPGLNAHLRLTLRLRTPRPSPGECEDAPLPKALQRKLIEPFGQVKGLHSVRIQGEHYEVIEKTLKEEMAKPYTDPEVCLDEALRLKDEGNAVLNKGDNKAAIAFYEQSFRAIHIICDGRRRSVWGDAFFHKEMRYGKHKGQQGGLVRLILRVKLVANIVCAYLRDKDYDMAYFWGKRTIDIMRENAEEDEDEPMLEFPAANELGKIYYRTGVAAKALDKKDEARRYLKVAMEYLPTDPQVKQEHATVALRLG